MKYLPLITALALAGCASSPSLKDPLSLLSRDVNRHMEYLSDTEQYGVSDKWVAGCPAKGDCEDYALCKMELLLRMGYAPSRVGIMVVMDDQRQIPHAVAVVDDNVVLDNLSKNSEPISSKPYTPIYSCLADGSMKVYVKDGKKLTAIQRNHRLEKCGAVDTASGRTETKE